MFSGTFGRFYESLRWPGWKAEAAALHPRQGLSVIPFLWSGGARTTTSRPRAAALRRYRDCSACTMSSCGSDGRPGAGIPRIDRAPCGEAQVGNPGDGPLSCPLRDPADPGAFYRPYRYVHTTLPHRLRGLRRYSVDRTHAAL
jgi:hypothetical protein